MTFSWQMAEELAAAHMREIGFSDARRTRDGSDGGVDVVGSGVVAQVKYLSTAVGSPDIQRLRGAAHGVALALFYSFSDYTTAAQNVADSNNVALFRYTLNASVSPSNDHARRVLGGSASLLTLQELFNRSQLLMLRCQAWVNSIEPAFELILKSSMPVSEREAQALVMERLMHDRLQPVAAKRMLILDELGDLAERIGGNVVKVSEQLRASEARLHQLRVEAERALPSWYRLAKLELRDLGNSDMSAAITLRESAVRLTL